VGWVWWVVGGGGGGSPTDVRSLQERATSGVEKKERCIRNGAAVSWDGFVKASRG